MYLYTATARRRMSTLEQPFLSAISCKMSFIFRLNSTVSTGIFGLLQSNTVPARQLSEKFVEYAVKAYIEHVILLRPHSITNGDPSGIRTHDLLFRRETLWSN